jgi:hypothetical protein
MTPRFRPEGVTMGLGLLGLGVATLLGNLGRLDLLSTVRHGWPLLLIVWGGLELWLTFSSRRSA